MAYSVLLLLGALPWAASFGMGLYLHSPLYRWAMERELTAFFGLPTRVGQVVPLSWHQRQVQDVEIFLPSPVGDRGELTPANRVAHCRQAQWVHSAVPGRFDLVLSEGALDLTPARWARGDFRRLEKSLQHDYLELSLNKINIYRSSVRWAHEELSIELGSAEGEVLFVGEGNQSEGVARLSAGLLNGQPASVAVHARFDPLSEAVNDRRGEGLVHEFVLTTSPDRPMPIRQLKLDRLLGGPVTQGQFAGRLSYLARAGDRRNVFAITDGKLTGVQLAELTRILPSGPITGQLDLKIGQLRIEQPAQPDRSANGDCFLLTRLRFSGVVSDLDLASTLAAAGLTPCGGKIRLQVQDADFGPGPIRLVRATGSAAGLDLAQLSGLLQRRLGAGRIRGPAKLANCQVVIENGNLIVLDADLFGAAAAEASGRCVVDMKLIEAILPVVSWVKQLPVKLPEAIPYRSLGAHVFKDGDRLILQGLGGSDGKSMMTLLIPMPGWSQTLGVPKTIAVNVPAPGFDKPFDLAGLTRRLARPLKPIALRMVGRSIRRKLLAPRATQPD